VVDWYFRTLDPLAAVAARGAFSDYLRACCEERSDFAAAELIFGELASNVVRHAPGPVEITVRPGTLGSVILTFYDRGPAFAVPGSYATPDPTQESGRGLFLICSLGLSLDVARRHNGNAITVVLPVQLQVALQREQRA
jgi:anti-sigma regulatory factor (Ser/Thr protein kinase)